jgi:hypothetical protein
MSQFNNMQEVALDGETRSNEGRLPMTRTTLLITLAAAAALAGCNKEDHTIVAGPPVDEGNVTSNGPVALPPSISSSKSYRCADNKLVYIDWMSDGSARVKKTREEIGTSVTPGTALKGDANAKTISYNGQNCKA